MFSFHLLIMSIHIYIKSGSTNKEATILRQHISTVAQKADLLGGGVSHVTLQLVWEKCEIKGGIRKRGLISKVAFFPDGTCWCETNVLRSDAEVACCLQGESLRPPSRLQCIAWFAKAKVTAWPRHGRNATHSKGIHLFAVYFITARKSYTVGL